MKTRRDEASLELRGVGAAKTQAPGCFEREAAEAVAAAAWNSPFGLRFRPNCPTRYGQGRHFAAGTRRKPIRGSKGHRA
jgi:hypothetical protein